MIGCCAISLLTECKVAIAVRLGLCHHWLGFMYSALSGPSDVGGGAVKNGTRHALSRIPLRWMIRECFLTQTGIMFKADALREVGLDPSRLYPHVLPRPEALLLEQANPDRVGYKNGAVSVVQPGVILSEEEEDLADALSPINDQLSLSPVWWVLELVPMRQKCLRKNGTWGTQMRSGTFMVEFK